MLTWLVIDSVDN